MTPSPQITVPPPGGKTSLVDRINLTLHARRYFKLIARRWLILAACVLVSASYHIYKAANAPDMFRAKAVLYVPPKVQGNFEAGPQFREEMSSYYPNQIENMKDANLIAEVNNRFEKENPLLLGRIRGWGADKGIGASFDLTVDGTDLNAVKAYARIWAEEVVKGKEKTRQASFSRTEGTRQGQVDGFKKQRDAAQAEIDAFIKTNNITSIRETTQGAQSRLDEALATKNMYRTLWATLEARAAVDLAVNGFPISPGVGDSSASRQDRPADYRLVNESRYNMLRNQLNELENRLEKLNETLREKHPTIRQLTEARDRKANEIAQELQLMEDRRLARIAEFKSFEKAQDEIIEKETADVRRGAELTRAYDTLVKKKEDFETFLQGLQKDLVSFELADEDDPPFELRGVTGHPAGPDRRKMVLTGILYGFALGFGIIYFLHRLDDRLELAQDIEAELEEPVLGQIPQVEAKLLHGGPLLITNLDQHNFFSESIRGIRSAVMFGSQTGKKQVMLITSAVPADGKTTFTVNFAATLALAGHRVLLVDADLRRGNVHNYFKQKRDPGFSEVLSGGVHWQDVVIQSDLKTLEVIPSGALPTNPGELLISPINRQFIEEVRQHYDYVIFDCPPLTAIDDTFSMVGLADGMLFVVRAGQTSMRFAKNALAAIRQRGASIFGIVLNGITADNPYYYYNSYYHAYYNKGKSVTGSVKNLTPGATMASPRRSRTVITSIEAEAKARASQKAREEGGAAVSGESKAEAFRKRRAAAAAENAEVKEEAAPAPQAESSKTSGQQELS